MAPEASLTEPRIIVGCDGSQESRDALTFGARIAERTGAHLTLVAAFPHLRSHAGSEAFELALGRKSDPIFADARTELGPIAAGVPVHELSVGDGSTDALLSRVADGENADLIVLGSSHRAPLALAMLGGTADRVIRTAPCPVAIAPRGYGDRRDGGLRLVGAAYDGTAGAERAVRQATAIARVLSARLRVISVVERIGTADIAYAGQTPDGPDARFSRRMLERASSDLLASLPDDLDAESLILSGDPVEALAGEGSEQLDALVVGTHADGPVLRALLGSVSTPVSRTAACPVIVVPPQAAVGFGAWDGEPPLRLAWRVAAASARSTEGAAR
jgi:nucleotide-binding universal stress UspA family protein